MLPRMRFLGFIVGAVTIAAACNVEKTPVEFSVPRSELGEPFLLTPWPSDLLRTENGLDLLRFPNPFGSSALEDAIQLIATNPAYAASMTMYFRINGGVDETSLPQTAAASLEAN